jgi:hemolysin D
VAADGLRLIALLWAVFGHIDVVATAQGKIVPNAGSKVIQPIETAAVLAIHVATARRSRPGRMLVELDATVARADSTRSANDLAAARLQAARARALLAALASGKAPRIEPPDPAAIGAERIAQEQRVLDGQYGEYRRAPSASTPRSPSAKPNGVPPKKSCASWNRPCPSPAACRDYKGLVEKNFISKHGYLEKEQVRIEQEADLQTQKSRLKELAAAIAEARGQRAALTAETRRTALDSLNEAEQKAPPTARNCSSPMPAAAHDADRAGRRHGAATGRAHRWRRGHPGAGADGDRAPRRRPGSRGLPREQGHRLRRRRAGGRSQDRDLPLHQVRHHPRASLTHVSHDAIRHKRREKRRGLVYSTRAKLPAPRSRSTDKTVNLTAGMAVSVEIKTGKRRVIEYFLSPLLQRGSESLRER